MLAIFSMNSEKALKVNYFSLSDFCVKTSFDTKVDFEMLNKYSSLIPWRFKRSEGYVDDFDKLRCILSGILIYKSFGDAEKDVLYNKFNKPYFSNAKWNFNISHSGDYVVFVRDSEKVGIDIEKVLKENIDILNYPFNDSEKAFIGSDVAKLTKLWTIKESVFKASGIEESTEYRDIDVANSLNNGPISLSDVEYNIISECMDDYYISVATVKKYDKILLAKEKL